MTRDLSRRLNRLSPRRENLRIEQMTDAELMAIVDTHRDVLTTAGVPWARIARLEDYLEFIQSDEGATYEHEA